MNDVVGHWIPPEEDGNETALEIFRRNVWQRYLERRTRKEDERHLLGEMPMVDVRRRLVEQR